MGVRRSVTGILAGTLGCLALLLSACGGGDDSVADPPVSPATSSPTESPQHESAEQFIRRWTQLEETMENSGNVDAYLAVSRTCKPCVKLAREVEGFYKAGGFVRWGGWTIKSIERSGRDDGSVTFTVRIQSAPTTYRESDTSQTTHLNGGPSTELLTLRHSASGWIMQNTAEQAS